MDIKKRIGIMGGTFNPIHLGHLIVAENAYEELNLDEVLFVPSGNPYMKDYVDVLDAKTRIDLVGEAIDDNHHFAMSTIEVDRDGNSYSYETIASLKQANPDTEYFFMVGADSLFMMEKWMCPEKIFSEVTVAVASRGGVDQEKMLEQVAYLEEKYNTKIVVLHSRAVEISSTQIRERVRKGQSIRYMVRYKTEQVIRKKGLYLD
ncbi:MAG: nicotinate-nucleotide adenylyltransferase [Lachnospiraceae bacterium]|nr:nicotinate-nucleotide adenylyltransferase [Lachnospiraceae bacterium]